MSEKQQLYEALIDERNRIIKKVEKYDIGLAYELKILLRMIDRNAPKDVGFKVTAVNSDPTIFDSGGEVETKLMFRPTTIIRGLFNENPEREFSPAELRDTLKEFHERGKLIVRGKKLLVTTHSVLRIFLDKGFIIKIDKPDGVPVYMKS